MVFDALIEKLLRLEIAHAESQESEVSSLILAAMKLIQYGLRDAISFERGGDVAAQLDRTYSVWMLALEFFDSKREIEKIVALTESVRGVRDAWDSVFTSIEGGVTRPSSL
jgi:flagellin-specific chaperone FliS